MNVPVGDLGEDQADTHAGTAVGDAGVGPDFGLAEPDAEFQALAEFEGDGDFDVASAEAEVGDAAPKGGAFLNVNLDGILTAIAGVLAIVDRDGIVVIDGVGGEGKIPQRFFGGDVEQTEVAGAGSCGFADPLHAEVCAIRAVGEADYFVEAEIGTDCCEMCAFAADVDGGNFFGEDLTVTVGAENAYGDFDVFPGLGAPAHPCWQPPLA